MAASNQFNAKTHAKFQALVNAIATLLPNPTVGTQTFSGFDFSLSPGFTLNLTVSPDGQTLSVTCKDSDQGQNNAFGAVDGGVAGHYSRSPALIVQGPQMP